MTPKIPARSPSSKPQARESRRKWKWCTWIFFKQTLPPGGPNKFSALPFSSPESTEKSSWRSGWERKPPEQNWAIQFNRTEPYNSRVDLPSENSGGLSWISNQVNLHRKFRLVFCFLSSLPLLPPLCYSTFTFLPLYLSQGHEREIP